MRIVNKELFIPNEKLKIKSLQDLLEYFKGGDLNEIPRDSVPIRFIIVESDKTGYKCEVDVLEMEKDDKKYPAPENIFEFRKRKFENVDKFNAVLLIPTGIGAQIGGHCGDGNVVARLIASACDMLITHPNVVNASDINEMTENTLYVEGSTLTRLLMGKIGLQKIRANKVLMLMDKSENTAINNEVINAVSSARITLGLECDVMEIPNVIESDSVYSKSGRATGRINHLEKLFEIIQKNKSDYDAIALTTEINVSPSCHREYFIEGKDMVNPWGGIEAMLTHSVAQEFNMPCAHSPMRLSKADVLEDMGHIVDPRKAPETASITYLHCILKGLCKSPQITSPENGLRVEDISCMVIPDKCIGLPTIACLEQGIPVIAVRENKNKMLNDLDILPFKKGKLFVVNSYLEAVGVMHAIKSGVSIDSMKRPIKETIYSKA